MATLTKQYLDKDGLNALWKKIDDTFSPRGLAYRPTGLAADESTLTITFKNAKDENINVILPVVNGKEEFSPHAGLMSPSDKSKLDGLDSTAENAVTLKNILVGGGDDNVNPVKLTVNTTQTDVTKDDYKAVAFGLNYDLDSDLLSIVDLNTQVKDANGKVITPATALSSVHILGDALKNAMIESVAVKDVDNTGKSGLFLEFVFKTTDQTGKDNVSNVVYVDVADLVDVYTAGVGIDIEDSNNAGAGDGNRTTVINIKSADDDEIGGIKVYKVNKTNDNTGYSIEAITSNISGDITGINHRYLAVELDKNNRAFVYNPVEVINISDPTEATGTTQHNGTFTAVTGLDTSVDNTTGNITITPTVTTYTLPSETTLSKGTEAAATQSKLKFGDKFTVVTDTTVDNHKITDVNTEFELPVETQLDTVVDETVSNEDINVVSNNTEEDDTANPKIEPKLTVTLEFETLDEVTVTNHRITQKRKKHTAVIDIESIPTCYIDSLTLGSEA